MLRLLRELSWPEWRAHPWRQGIALLAVALGVALAFSVHLINASALAEFGAAVHAVNGEPDFELRATGAAGFDEALYAQVAAHLQVALASPLIESGAQALRPDGQRVPLRVIGIGIAAPFGLEAIAWSIAATSLVRSLLIYRGLAALTGLRFADLCATLGRSGGVTVCAALPPLLLTLAPGLQHVPPLMFLALAGGGAMLSWCAGILLLNHELKAELVTVTRQLSQRLAPRPARR
jgi:putative ABC transport system permease protein